MRERSVVDDRVEDVAGFLETVCAPIFKQNLVILTGGRKEENRFDIVKALIPTLAL